MDTQMDPAEAVHQLWLACARWEALASSVEDLAGRGFIEGSRIHADNLAASVVSDPPAISRYLQERTWNLARMLRAVHEMTFNTTPGSLFLNPTVLYPLMRAALEDAASIVWLQTPTALEERLSRTLRSLSTEMRYYVRNQTLLARAVAEVDIPGVDVAELSEGLLAHMREEERKAGEHFALLADELQLDVKAVTKSLPTSAPITSVYGEAGVERVAWGMLSDFSHFSYLMLRFTSGADQPDPSAPVLHTTMLQLTNTLNAVISDAIDLLATACIPKA